jgi:hypothetical protein
MFVPCILISWNIHRPSLGKRLACAGFALLKVPSLAVKVTAAVGGETLVRNLKLGPPVEPLSRPSLHRKITVPDNQLLHLRSTMSNTMPQQGLDFQVRSAECTADEAGVQLSTDRVEYLFTAPSPSCNEATTSPVAPETWLAPPRDAGRYGCPIGLSYGN